VTVVTAPAAKDPPAMAGGARPPLELLWESKATSADDVRGRGMPDELARRYDGELLVPLHPDRPTVLANFASTLDGIVAYGTGELAGGGLISGGHEPDRFVMGLLRTLADVVVVGAGTVRGSSAHRWTPGHVHPASAPLFQAWRGSMGLAANPTTVIVTGSGDIPLGHAGINDTAIPVVIATTPRGAERLRGEPLSDHVTVEAVGSGECLTGEDILSVATIREAGVVLTEGGPHLLGELLGADILDELFLTLAPQLAGRAADGRLGLVEGVAFAPADARWERLESIRRSTDHLFLRYARREALDPR
jgi:riboflavin biosynthesis pyrimidine reductase